MSLFYELLPKTFSEILEFNTLNTSQERKGRVRGKISLQNWNLHQTLTLSSRARNSSFHTYSLLPPSYRRKQSSERKELF